jgi:hypothetical protein
MLTLQETIDTQRAAALAHRLRLGLGEYSALVSTQVLYNVPVEWLDTDGKRQSDDCATVHVDKSMVVLHVNGGNGRGIVRRLGCKGLKIDGK